MKSFEKAIRYKWLARASHAFLLYLNVSDDIFCEDGNGETRVECMDEHICS